MLRRRKNFHLPFQVAATDMRYFSKKKESLEEFSSQEKLWLNPKSGIKVRILIFRWRWDNSLMFE